MRLFDEPADFDSVTEIGMDAYGQPMLACRSFAELLMQTQHLAGPVAPLDHVWRGD